MKIVAINSSFRKRGNTEKIIRLVEDMLKEKAENRSILGTTGVA